MTFAQIKILVGYSSTLTWSYVARGLVVATNLGIALVTNRANWPNDDKLIFWRGTPFCWWDQLLSCCLGWDISTILSLFLFVAEITLEKIIFFGYYWSTCAVFIYFHCRKRFKSLSFLMIVPVSWLPRRIGWFSQRKSSVCTYQPLSPTIWTFFSSLTTSQMKNCQISPCFLIL